MLITGLKYKYTEALTLQLQEPMRQTGVAQPTQSLSSGPLLCASAHLAPPFAAGASMRHACTHI